MIVGENLKELIKKYSIVRETAFDKTCIKLTLDAAILKYKVPDTVVVNYDMTNVEKLVNKKVLKRDVGYTLEPRECILGCSAEEIKMPVFCFGLLQTKGSLARLFVSINSADGQIDPGYEGKITFEIYNASDFKINIKPGQAVGNLYLFKTSTAVPPYEGRYANAKIPTHTIIDS